MNSLDMPRQITPLRKGTWAHWTTKWFFSWVHSEVVSQVAWLIEQLITTIDYTFERFLHSFGFRVKHFYYFKFILIIIILIKLGLRLLHLSLIWFGLFRIQSRPRTTFLLNRLLWLWLRRIGFINFLNHKILEGL